MSEDPLAHEVAALTRRFENSLQIVRGDIAQLDNRMMTVESGLAAVHERIDALAAEVRTGNARVIELLTRLVGETPE